MDYFSEANQFKSTNKLITIYLTNEFIIITINKIIPTNGFI